MHTIIIIRVKKTRQKQVVHAHRESNSDAAVIAFMGGTRSLRYKSFTFYYEICYAAAIYLSSFTRRTFTKKLN